MFVLAGPVDAVARRVLERLDAAGHVVGVLGHTAARLEADGIPYALDMPVHRPRDVERHLADVRGVLLTPGDPPVPPSRLVQDLHERVTLVVSSVAGADAGHGDATLREAGFIERIASRHPGHAIVRHHMLHLEALRLAQMQTIPCPRDVGIGFVHLDDVASVIIARLLRGDQQHIMATGPRLWGLDELADAVGHDAVPVDDDELVTLLEAGGFHGRAARRTAAAILAHRGLEPTRAVKAATGQPPHALEPMLADERIADEAEATARGLDAV